MVPLGIGEPDVSSSVQADAMQLPFPEGSFDAVATDVVPIAELCPDGADGDKTSFGRIEALPLEIRWARSI